MKDDRWLEIEEDFNGASNHFRLAVQLFKRGGFAEEGIEGYALTYPSLLPKAFLRACYQN